MSWANVSALYRQEAPVSLVIGAISSAAEGNPFSWDTQEGLLERVVLPVVRHAPSPWYTAQLLRTYSDAAIASGAEDLSDGLFTHLAELQPRSNDRSGHLAFTVPSGRRGGDGEPAASRELVLRVEPRHNEVGLRMWEAGYLLTEYIVINPALVRGKRVVELGAGLGLTGMAAAACCGASHTTLTDCARSVLDNLEDALEMNGLSPGKNRQPQCAAQTEIDRASSSKTAEAEAVDGEGGAEGGGVAGGGAEGHHPRPPPPEARVDVMALNWLDGGTAACTALGIDSEGGKDLVILAADVMYDPDLVPDLLNVIQQLLACALQHGAASVAYLAATRRNEATLGIFFNEVKSRPLSCAKCTFSWPAESPCDRPFFFDPRAVLLFEIRAAEGGGPVRSGGGDGKCP